MKQRLIFLDIDGTLTEPGSNVPPGSALEAIKTARLNGHKVFLCSGRCLKMLSPLLEYPFDGVIASAGGYIEYEGKIIYERPMTREQQTKAQTVFRKNGVYLTIEGKNGSYADEGIKDFLRENIKTEASSELLRWREQLEQNLGIRPMSEYTGEPIYKMIFMCPSMKQLEEPTQVLGRDFNFCIQDASPFGIVDGELINKEFNKGTAVKRLCEYLGVPLDCTVAFGDSMNDLEMIETAALGICMDNGSAELKKFADEICPSVGDNGLYKSFQAHGLLKPPV